MVNENYSSRIFDFGLSVELKEADKDVRRVGTPTYVSPEVLLDGKVVGQQSDIYLMATITCELLGMPNLREDLALEKLFNLVMSKRYSFNFDFDFNYSSKHKTTISQLYSEDASNLLSTLKQASSFKASERGSAQDVLNVINTIRLTRKLATAQRENKEEKSTYSNLSKAANAAYETRELLREAKTDSSYTLDKVVDTFNMKLSDIVDLPLVITEYIEIVGLNPLAGLNNKKDILDKLKKICSELMLVNLVDLEFIKLHSETNGNNYYIERIKDFRRFAIEHIQALPDE